MAQRVKDLGVVTAVAQVPALALELAHAAGVAKKKKKKKVLSESFPDALALLISLPSCRACMLYPTT